MDIDKLFQPVADYLNFFIDFVLLRGMGAEFTKLDSVNAKLISFFLFGALLGLVIYRAKRAPSVGTVYPSPSEDERPVLTTVKDQLEHGDLLLFVLAVVIGASFTHLALLISSLCVNISIGTYKDTLNGALAASAIQYPMQAAMARIYKSVERIKDQGCAGGIVFLVANVVAMVGGALLLYYGFWAIAQTHGLQMRQMWLPFFVFLGLGAPIILTVAYGWVLALRAKDRDHKPDAGSVPAEPKS